MEINNKQIENPNKIRKIESEIFILNRDNLDNYYLSDPDELIIINSSYEYSHQFMQTIIDGGIKSNVKKIITSDSVIIKYIKYIKNIFKNLFPNCKTIKINSLENDFNLIAYIIDNTEIIDCIEYVLNDYIYQNKSFQKYILFTNSFLTGDLMNIKNIKIINNIISEPKCGLEKKIFDNFIDYNLIEKKNNTQLENIIKHNINQKSINYIYFEYIDKQRNKFFNINIINMVDIDFLSFDLIL